MCKATYNQNCYYLFMFNTHLTHLIHIGQLTLPPVQHKAVYMSGPSV